MILKWISAFLNNEIMKNILILPFLVFLLFCNSCSKEIKSERGGIDIITNVYFNASRGLDNMHNFHLSRINYSGDTIIELVPDMNMPEITRDIYYIQDSLYYSLGIAGSKEIIFSDIIKNKKGSKLVNKSEGALFSNDWIPNYINRKNLNDTLLFNKKYKRFEINSPWSYRRFYIFKTDTILPYSMYRHAEKDYKGRVERIDTYNKKENIFVTLQILPRKTWDIEAKEIFEFNKFLNSKK